jgi:enamine deaminase RidA (YjgF/YER057c/UK114 family)
MGAYRTVVVSGKVAYVSGHAPLRADGSRTCGRLGEDLDVEAGKAAARQCGLAILASLKAELGSLDRIGRLIKLLGMVNASSDFQQHPQVVNGCSELFIEVFGSERGLGARSAAGMSSLPGNIAVEIEAVFEVD